MLVFCAGISSRDEMISASSENCLSSLMRFLPGLVAQINRFDIMKGKSYFNCHSFLKSLFQFNSLL